MRNPLSLGFDKRLFENADPFFRDVVWYRSQRPAKKFTGLANENL
jgi:hypothetical protein